VQQPPPPAKPISGPFQQGPQPLPPPEPFLPFHSISDQTWAHFSPKNVFVQILVRNGDFFVWENDLKKPPPTHPTHTAIISPGLNMAAGLASPASPVKVYRLYRPFHLIKLLEFTHPPPKVYRPYRFTTTKVYRLYRSLPAVQTGHTGLPAAYKSTGRTKVYRLFRLAAQVYRLFKSLPAVQKSTGCSHLPPSLPVVQV
jgi:hypothetical protein